MTSTIAPPMSEKDAAWIRDHVWPRKLRAAYKMAAKRGGNLNACRCQRETSWHCRNGTHRLCSPEDTWASPETYVLRADGETRAKLPGWRPFHDRMTGEVRYSGDVGVWLADRICKFSCGCDCAEHHEALPPLPRSHLHQFHGYAIDATEVYVDGLPNEVQVKINGVRVASSFSCLYWENATWIRDAIKEMERTLDRSCLPEHWKPLRDPEAMKTIPQVPPPAWLPEGPNVGDVVQHPEHGRCEVLWARDQPEGRRLDLYLIYSRDRQAEIRYRPPHIQTDVPAAEVAVMERSRRPLPAMSEEDAAWIRDTVWTKPMRGTFASSPRFELACACQWGPTGSCADGRHEECQFAKPGAGPERDSETSITRAAGSVINGAEVWLADRICRWTCPCGCGHQPPKKKRKAKRRPKLAPTAPPRRPQPRPVVKPEQLSLFG